MKKFDKEVENGSNRIIFKTSSFLDNLHGSDLYESEYHKLKWLIDMGKLCVDIKILKENREKEVRSENKIDDILLEKLLELAKRMILCKIPFIQIQHFTELHMQLLINLDKEYHEHMGRRYVYIDAKYSDDRYNY